MICLQLASVASAADALKIFPAVRIPCPQLADKPCWDDVIYMTFRSGMFEVHAARFHFAISTKSRRSMTAPPSSIRRCARPFTVHTFPTDWLFLRPKFCLTELAAAVTVCLAAKTLSSEDVRLAIFAVGTAHGHTPPSSVNDYGGKTTLRVKSERQ